MRKNCSKRTFSIPECPILVFRNGILQAKGKDNDFIIKKNQVVFNKDVEKSEQIRILVVGNYEN